MGPIFAAGLNNYIGFSFKVYRHSINENTSISDNYITHLFLDNQRISRIRKKKQFKYL